MTTENATSSWDKDKERIEELEKENAELRAALRQALDGIAEVIADIEAYWQADTERQS